VIAPSHEKQSSPFAQAGLGALVLVVVAALFGLKPQTDAEKPAGKPDGKDAPIAASDMADANEPHLVFLLKHLRAKPIPGGARPQATADAFGEFISRLFSSISPQQPTFTEEHAKRLKVLIATVPDPVDTAFGFWYDQILESLTRAVCDTDLYAPAGQWTPWEQYRVAAQGKDSKKGETRPPGPAFMHYPGVLLFHSTEKNKTDHLLAVLLVGETTASVRADPLYRALRLARALALARKDQEEVRLIAPVFTGAQASLLAALGQWNKQWNDNAKFTVMSGAAGGMSEVVTTDPAITLQSTIIPSKILANAAVYFLRHNGAGDSDKVIIGEDGVVVNGPPGVDAAAAETSPADFYDRVAFLVESDTGFGRSMGNTNESLSNNTKPQKQQPWPMYLPYPMHISRLQRVYTKIRMDKEERIGLGGPLAHGPERRAVRSNPDTLPSMDELETTRINDGAVDDITATIRQNHVRHVGILATDPEDKVFLVERLRRNCPNVEIFLSPMERTYVLPENRQIMRGVIITTTYPLYPPNQGWTDPQEPRRQTFKSACGQGYYNAAFFHLADMLAAKEKDDFCALHLQEYAPPFFALSGRDKTKPPVWIMTIGEKGQLVPLTFFKNYETKIKDLMAVALPPPLESPQTATIMLPNLGPYRALGMIVLVAAGAIVWFSIRRRSSRWLFFGSAPAPAAGAGLPWRQRLRNWFAAPMTADGEQGVSVCHSLILAALVFCLVPTLTVVAVLLSSVFFKTIVDWVCLVPIGICLTLAILCSLCLQLRQIVKFARSTHNDTGTWWSRLVTNVVLLLGGVAFAIALTRHVPTEPAHRVLFVARTADVLTGYSVLPPVLLLGAGFIVYAYFALKRDYLGKRFAVECPYPAAPVPPKQASGVEQICHKINAMANDVREDMTDFPCYRDRHRPLLIVGALIFVPSALVVIARCLRAHGTWEGWLWDALFLTGFLTLAVLVLLTLLRFAAGWRGLERMLKLMALVPMVRAFDRLPRKTAALFGGYFFARRPRVSHLAIPAHILRQLQHEACQPMVSPATAPVAVLAGAVAAGPVPGAQPANGPQVHGLSHPANVVHSQMPSYDAVPQRIAERLSAGAFDFMPDPAANPEPAPDKPYPTDEINNFSRQAQTLIGDLQPYWPWHTVADAFGEQVTLAEPGKEKRTKKAAMPAWVEKAEDFVAIQTIIFLSQYFILLRTTALSMVWVAVLLLWAASAYIFQPEQLILYLLIGLLSAVVGVILWVLIRVNKNEIVSRITQSTPNRFDLNWTFVLAAIQFVGPIAIILIAHLSGRLRTIVDPFLEVLP